MIFNRSVHQLGCLAVISLVALRLGVGWHFFKEGSKKFTGDDFTSVYFLQDAKGPFAERHKAMIPDRFGFERLNHDRTVAFWSQYKSKVERRLGFNADQSEQANRLIQLYSQRLKNYLASNDADIQEYFLGVDRYREATKSRLAEVPFQSERLAQMEAELRSTAAPWLKGVDDFGKQLENDLHALADHNQVSGRHVAMRDRSKPPVDNVVKYVVFGVGVLLILGLFTRIAALAGIGFLTMVMSTQPPWVAGSAPIYYQVVEALALFVLFAFSAGRLGGLDYVVHGLFRRSSSPPETELN